MDPYVLHTFPNRFVIDLENNSDSLCIDRSSGSLSLVPAVRISVDAYSQRIGCLVGLVTLLRGKYLIICTGSQSVATIHGCEIRQLTTFQILPLALTTTSGNKNKTGQTLTTKQEADENRYIALLSSALKKGLFYFSYDYDLTLSTQRIAIMRQNAQQKLPLYKRQDERFFWNRYLLSSVIEGGFSHFIIPLMSGYVYSGTVRVPSSNSASRAIIDFYLISRRSCERTGKRFVTRGIDQQGNAANFAETEQAVFVTNDDDPTTTQMFSLVQTRGSIPVLWQQPCTLKYTPKIQLVKEGRDTESSFRKHFEQQVKLYSNNVCVNLVNSHGSEHNLTRAFQKQVDLANSPCIRLINFDFHKECKKMKYENIGRLVNQIKDDVEQFHYFSGRLTSPSGVSSYNRRQEWTTTTTQNGTIRTNCIDCLDRTNVVQSVFARLALEKQLLSVGVLSSSSPTLSVGPGKYVFPGELESMFKNVWANNADAMSMQYSGTGALKTDYTRTGKRSTRGAIQDGVNSVTRYYLNNFCDGHAQDSLDLLLGHFRPSLSPSYVSPFDDDDGIVHGSSQGSVTLFFIRFAAALLVLSLAVSNFAPSYAFWDSWSLTSRIVMFTAATLGVGSRVLLRYGRKYANKPRLRQHTL